jgi:hypothetical protein
VPADQLAKGLPIAGDGQGGQLHIVQRGANRI